MTKAQLIEAIKKIDTAFDDMGGYWNDGCGCCGESTLREDVDYITIRDTLKSLEKEIQ